MRSTRDEVLATLRDLEIYVNSIDPVNRALANITDPSVRGYLTVRRRLDYAAFIGALYAAFEKFVEDLVWSHTELESATTPYRELSTTLRTKHLAQSATLLIKGRLGEGRYTDLTPVDAIASLHQCESGQQPYKLNRHAVVYHEHNLRPAIVQELFSLTGVSKINDLARQAAPMVQWSLRVSGASDVPLSSIERHLEEIVALRNQTAHTGVGSAQVLGSADMQEHLEFMKAYCLSLYMVIAGAYLDRAYIAKPNAAMALGEFLQGPLRKHGGAVVVRKPTCRTYVGQPVIGKRDKLVDRWGTIKEIHVDDKPVQAVDAAAQVVEIGLLVDFEVTGRTRLYLLDAKDDAVSW